MADHAKLSASGSHRWILCPGSVKAEEGLPDIPNKYSEEGLLAHELATRILGGKDYSDLNVTEEMVGYVKIYIDHLLARIWNPEWEEIENHALYIEKKVDYSHIIPEGFGTADAIVLITDNTDYFGDNKLHIIDLKYGQGAKVEAYENTQLLLYAIGALNTLDIDISKLSDIHLEIIQPRLNHKSKWSASIETLKYWEGYLKAKAEEALRPDAPRIPSEAACKWCKAASSCMALYNFANNFIDNSFNPNDPSETMDDSHIRKVLDNSKMVSQFLTRVEEGVYDRLLTGGTFEGYKLVNGKKVRKVKQTSEEIIVELLGEKAYNKTILGVKELEKLIDKETMESLVYISQNRPLLVKESDKREAIILGELDFDPVEC